MLQTTVKYAELRPEAFLRRLQEHPIAYLPLGTLEWHGPHLPLGADALQSEALMLAAAKKYGGIVLPPLFLGPDRMREEPDGTVLIGMDYAKSTSPEKQLPGSAYWVSYDFFKEMIAQILSQLKRAGFKKVFADGHGPSRRTWCEMIPMWEPQFDLKLYGITDEMRAEWNYMNDHAARNETSITMHTHPTLVDLSVYADGEQSPVTGVNGEHPCLATPEYGSALFQHALKYLGTLIK